MVLNSIWQTQTYIQAQAICLIFGQILHFWRVKFLATFQIEFCSQCMYVLGWPVQKFRMVAFLILLSSFMHRFAFEDL